MNPVERVTFEMIMQYAMSSFNFFFVEIRTICHALRLNVLQSLLIINVLLSLDYFPFLNSTII